MSNYQLPADQLEEASHAVNTMLEVMGRSRLTAPLVDVLVEHGVKRCSVCLELKHFESFYKDSSNRDGLERKCKACGSATPEELERYRERKQEHVKRANPVDDFEPQGYIPLAPQERLPEEVLSQAEATTTRIMHEFYNGRATTRFNDVLRAHSVKWCSGCQRLMYPESFPGNASTIDGLHSHCRDCNSKRGKAWRVDNPEAAKQRDREYYLRNHRVRYVDPEDSFRLTVQLSSGYNRAVAAGNTAERVTPDELYEFWNLIGIDPWKCYLTGEKLDHLTRSIDHVVPISEGGSHTVGNLLPTTTTANLSKQHRQAGEVISAESQRDVSTTANTNNKENQ